MHGHSGLHGAVVIDRIRTFRSIDMSWSKNTRACSGCRAAVRPWVCMCVERGVRLNVWLQALRRPWFMTFCSWCQHSSVAYVTMRQLPQCAKNGGGPCLLSDAQVLPDSQCAFLRHISPADNLGVFSSKFTVSGAPLLPADVDLASASGMACAAAICNCRHCAYSDLQSATGMAPDILAGFRHVYRQCNEGILWQMCV